MFNTDETLTVSQFIAKISRPEKKKQQQHEKYNKDTHIRQANTRRVHVKSNRDSGLKEITKADT